MPAYTGDFMNHRFLQRVSVVAALTLAAALGAPAAFGKSSGFGSSHSGSSSHSSSSSSGLSHTAGGSSGAGGSVATAAPRSGFSADAARNSAVSSGFSGGATGRVTAAATPLGTSLNAAQASRDAALTPNRTPVQLSAAGATGVGRSGAGTSPSYAPPYPQSYPTTSTPVAPAPVPAQIVVQTRPPVYVVQQSNSGSSFFWGWLLGHESAPSPTVIVQAAPPTPAAMLPQPNNLPAAGSAQGPVPAYSAADRGRNCRP
jgi:hypothetical protein